jgi:hypothetical protein
MKAVTAKTVKTEMASVETANLAKPEKTATKAATSKVETKVAKQDVGNAASSIPVKPTKTAVEKVAAKKVVTKTVPIKAGTAKATASKVDKHEISKPKVEKISVAKSDVTKSTAQKISATTAKKSRVIANPEPMKLLANKDARPSREEIEQMIAKAAYFRAEKRCFEVGYEQEDWLMAEQEINQLYVFES